MKHEIGEMGYVILLDKVVIQNQGICGYERLTKLKGA
jgi:hypothetical protein